MAERVARQAEGCFVLEGPKLLAEALRARAPVRAVYVDDDLSLTGPGSLPVLIEQARDQGASLHRLQSGVLDRVADVATPQPLLAVADMPRTGLATLRSCPLALVVVGVGLSDPGNVGTVARSAWAAGADAVAFCPPGADPFSPKAVRASAGAVFHLPVLAGADPEANAEGGAANLLAALGELGLWRWGTVASGGHDYATCDLTQPCALVLGNEAHGLALGELAPYLNGRLSVPMPGGAESLNVGMAAAVLCSEAARQRRLGPPGQAQAQPTTTPYRTTAS